MHRCVIAAQGLIMHARYQIRHVRYDALQYLSRSEDSDESDEFDVIQSTCFRLILPHGRSGLPEIICGDVTCMQVTYVLLPLKLFTSEL